MVQIPENLYGLVVCGGKSTRMGVDKCQLDYHGQPQALHLVEMLGKLCEKVLISCNQSQARDFFLDQETLTDLPEFDNIGPIAAVLTAFNAYPNKNFLIVGCDYPFISTQVLRNFLAYINPASMASAFFNNSNFYEPLLAWYSKDAATLLEKNLDQKNFSLRNFLESQGADKFFPDDQNVMISVDTPEQYLHAKSIIENSGNL